MGKLIIEDDVIVDNDSKYAQIIVPELEVAGRTIYKNISPYGPTSLNSIYTETDLPDEQRQLHPYYGISEFNYYTHPDTGEAYYVIRIKSNNILLNPSKYSIFKITSDHKFKIRTAIVLDNYEEDEGYMFLLGAENPNTNSQKNLYIYLDDGNTNETQNIYIERILI